MNSFGNTQGDKEQPENMMQSIHHKVLSYNRQI